MKKLKIKLSYVVKFIVALSILVVLISSVIHKGKVIVIEDNPSHVHKEIYLKDNSFTLSYTHSVHKTKFEEYFVVTDDNKFLLQKTIFDSFGVGSPYVDNLDDFKIENKKFVLKLDKYFKEINMVISPIPKHKITVGNETFSILDFLNEETKSIKLYPLEKYVITIGNRHIIL